MLFRPHYVRDYGRLTARLLKQFGRAEAMERAVGGDYETMGAIHVGVLREAGLRDDGYLIDVGCGAGRTAYALRQLNSLHYLGTDVVPALLDYAQERTARQDWRFVLVDGLSIPEADGSADMVAMFSVVTHLTPNEGYRYVGEAARVVKAGGSVVVSFLDEGNEAHRRAAGRPFEQFIHRLRGDVKNVLLTPHQIEGWAMSLGLCAQFFGPERFGQSYVVLTK